ncbi:hypothetical protein ACHAXT_002837 [Thalassiosira profunda]
MSLTTPPQNADKSDDESAGEGAQVLRLKNVLYYKKHSRTAIPIKGTLHLCQEKIHFQGKGVGFSWHLACIAVEPFKGRVNSGMKIVGRCIEGEFAEEEWTFTKVNQLSYDAIRSAVDEAKFDNEMKKVRRSSTDSTTNRRMSLSESLSADVEGVLSAERPSLLRRLCRFIFSVMYKVVSFLYKLFTGRRLWGPENMHHALQSVLAKIGPIRTCAKLTLPKRRVAAIQIHIDGIHESLLKIQKVVRRHQSMYLSRGVVAESVTQSSAIQRRNFVSFAILAICTFVDGAILAIRKRLRLDVLQLYYQYPTTVSQAVRNANDTLEALMELAVDEKYTSGKTAQQQILGEAQLIQQRLYDIKLIALAESSSGQKKKR